MEEDELKEEEEEEGCQGGDGWSREGEGRGGGRLGQPRRFCCVSLARRQEKCLGGITR